MRINAQFSRTNVKFFVYIHAKEDVSHTLVSLFLMNHIIWYAELLCLILKTIHKLSRFYQNRKPKQNLYKNPHGLSPFWIWTVWYYICYLLSHTLYSWYVGCLFFNTHELLTLHAIISTALKEMRTVANYFKMNQNFILVVKIRYKIRVSISPPPRYLTFLLVLSQYL